MLDLLPKRSTITGVFYANLLDQLRTAIPEKRRGKLSKGVLVQQNNARVHTCKVAMDAIERNGYELIPHPAYSPDLAPSDFFLFPNLNKSTASIIPRHSNYLLSPRFSEKASEILLSPPSVCPSVRLSVMLSPPKPLDRIQPNLVSGLLTQVGRARARLSLPRPQGPWGGVQRSNINNFQFQCQF